MILVSWTGKMIAAAWMLVAGAVGFAARAVGRGARDLDPHHRRDGVGLLTLGVAIVLAASLWVRMGNAAGRAIQTAAVDGFGSLSWILPVLAVLLAWRFLRHPDRNSETVRATIGWTALLLGVLGLIHIAKGTPRPADGARAMHLAGGYLGYAVSGPLSSALTRGWPCRCSRCWPCSASCSSPAPRCTGCRSGSARCGRCSGTAGRGPETAMTAWRSTRTTRPAPAARSAGRAARSPGRSGCARPSRPAITPSPTTRRCSSRTRSAASPARMAATA